MPDVVVYRRPPRYEFSVDAKDGGSRGIALAALGLLIVTGGCARGVVRAPDFATAPFAPFSREAAIAIALREWRLFGEPYDDRATCPPPSAPIDDPPERREGLWQRVAEYHWLGLPFAHPHGAQTGKHDARGAEFPPERDGWYAWSATFISYVMRMAGARDLFAYDDAHATYINQAARAALGIEPVRAAVAMRPEHHAPARGDVICAGRDEAAEMRFDDLPAPSFPSHCALVVAVDRGAVFVVGGNVADAVAMTRIPTTADGLLVDVDGRSIDACTSWFVVLAIRYEA